MKRGRGGAMPQNGPDPEGLARLNSRMKTPQMIAQEWATDPARMQAQRAAHGGAPVENVDLLVHRLRSAGGGAAPGMNRSGGFAGVPFRSPQQLQQQQMLARALEFRRNRRGGGWDGGGA